MREVLEPLEMASELRGPRQRLNVRRSELTALLAARAGDARLATWLWDHASLSEDRPVGVPRTVALRAWRPELIQRAGHAFEVADREGARRWLERAHRAGLLLDSTDQDASGLNGEPAVRVPRWGDEFVTVLEGEIERRSRVEIHDEVGDGLERLARALEDVAPPDPSWDSEPLDPTTLGAPMGDQIVMPQSLCDELPQGAERDPTMTALIEHGDDAVPTLLATLRHDERWARWMRCRGAPHGLGCRLDLLSVRGLAACALTRILEVPPGSLPSLRQPHIVARDLEERWCERGASGHDTAHCRARPVLEARLHVGTPEVRGPLDASAVRRVFTRHAAALRSCFTDGLHLLPETGGRVDIRALVSTRVLLTNISASTISAPAVERCVLDEVRTWTFPSPAVPATQVLQPLDLEVVQRRR